MKICKKVTRRFWRKVDRRGPDECWEWVAGRDPDGYGKFRLYQATARSNRVAWILANGPIPEGMYVCHKCDNPGCTNPAHLFLGTHTDNTLDMMDKGRSVRGEKNGNALLTEDQAREILSLRGNESQQTIANQFGITASTVNAIHRGRSWRHIS